MKINVFSVFLIDFSDGEMISCLRCVTRLVKIRQNILIEHHLNCENNAMLLANIQ